MDATGNARAFAVTLSDYRAAASPLCLPFQRSAGSIGLATASTSGIACIPPGLSGLDASHKLWNR